MQFEVQPPSLALAPRPQNIIIATADEEVTSAPDLPDLPEPALPPLPELPPSLPLAPTESSAAPAPGPTTDRSASESDIL